MDSLEELFGFVSNYCRGQMTEVAHNLWIRDLVPIKLENDTVYLGANSEFKQNLITEKYTPLLSEGFEKALGFPIIVKIECGNKSEPESDPDELVPKVMKGGEYDYTFDTFIVGPSNKFAEAAAYAVATHAVSNEYNPLFIYGDSGLGKTHLLMAIMNEVKKERPDSTVIYIKGETFTNELIAAIANKTTLEFKEKYRKADYLLVDDVQFISGKESTQEEFFHTFNYLYESNKQIVLTSDRPPKEIKTLEDRLRTRFEMGLLADIHPAEFETRVAIVQRKAQLLNVNIPNDVIQFIAESLKSNIRQLEGAVKNIKANSLIYEDKPITISIAKDIIKDILNDNQPVPVTIEKIISEVARTFNVSFDDIKGNRRSANISRARQVAMYIVKDITQLSMAAIGDEFGGRDHSTVVYAIGQVEKQMFEDHKLKELVDDMTKNIRDL